MFPKSNLNVFFSCILAIKEFWRWSISIGVLDELDITTEPRIVVSVDAFFAT